MNWHIQSEWFNRMFDCYIREYQSNLGAQGIYLFTYPTHEMKNSHCLKIFWSPWKTPLYVPAMAMLWQYIKMHKVKQFAVTIALTLCMFTGQ